jgi:hypothetical protein
MKISKMREDYDYFTGKVSEIVRQLNLAGVAIIWIFRVGKETGGVQYAASLKWVLGLFVLSLAFDLLQYIYQSVVWGSLNTHYYRLHKNEEKDIKVSGAWNYIALVFFWLKAVLTMVSYVLLFKFIYEQF